MANYSVLILEGNMVEREKYKRAFREAGNFEVIGESSDANIGYNMICEKKPDLVIMDIVLDSFDGYELLEKFRGEKLSTKFLIVSSLKSEGFIQKAFDLGATYYMLKPVMTELLVRRATELIEDKLDDGFVSVEKNSKNKEIEEKLSNIFLSIGIPAHIKGYQFLREAVKIAMKTPSIINSITGELYPSIAKHFSTSASKVERAIRHAIEVAWNRGRIENINQLFGVDIYSPNDKPTNGEFIALIADKMLFEGA